MNYFIANKLGCDKNLYFFDVEFAVEVVLVERPEHGSAEAFLFQIAGLHLQSQSVVFLPKLINYWEMNSL